MANFMTPSLGAGSIHGVDEPFVTGSRVVSDLLMPQCPGTYIKVVFSCSKRNLSYFRDIRAKRVTFSFLRDLCGLAVYMRCAIPLCCFQSQAAR